MCHHYLGAERLQDWLVDEYDLRANLRLLEEYNGGFYPLRRAPVIWASDEQYEFSAMEWGLLPLWWKPSDRTPMRHTFQRRTFNARSETAHEKPAYRNAFKKRRCLVPCQAFDEKRHYFSLPSGDAMCFAGLWDCWSEGPHDVVFTFTILTTEPNGAVAGVGHHRMPVLLTTLDDCRLWMNPDHVERGPLEPLFEPYAGELECRAAG